VSPDDGFGSVLGRPTIAFDLDGTLSDWEAAIRRAEPDHADRLLEVLDRLHPRQDGHLVDGAHYLLFVNGADIWAEVLGTQDGAIEASERFEAGFQAVAFAEADAVLAELADRFRLALVTNSPRAHAALADMGLTDHFDVVVEIPPGLRKPRAEGFWHAAGQLGVDPGDLVYVGDSYRCDVQGGLAAGVRPIWVDRWDTGLPVPDGVVRITDLAALPAVLP
jgi:HAD superfamily hydrolase (TIGR01549 family)